MSSIAGKGAEIQVAPAIHTGCLTYGPLNTEGVSRVSLAYDHRVMDGSIVGEILGRLEVVLCESLRLELLNITPINKNISRVA